MLKISLFILILLLSTLSLSAQSLSDINLVDAVTGKSIKIQNEVKGRGLILIFQTLDCPFGKMYESRIIALRSKYTSQGFNFILVDPGTKDDPTSMKNYIDESGINTPFLLDSEFSLTTHFGITKIPEVVVLTPVSGGASIRYRGAIDNNAQAEGSANSRFLDNALDQLLKGEDPVPSQARPVGCNVRAF
jgi:thioredoxin-related protein